MDVSGLIVTISDEISKLDRVTITLFFLVAATVTYLQSSRHHTKYPPCPLRPWPVVGNLLQLKENPMKQFAKFREQYGDLFSLYLGQTHVIVINGHDTVREALVKKADVFSHRSTIFVDKAIGLPNKGIGASNGANWKQNRNLSLNILRNFGFGKNLMAKTMQGEIGNYMDVLEDFHGEPQDVALLNRVFLANTMCSILLGKRFDFRDENYKGMISLVRTTFDNMRGTSLLNYFPVLERLPGDLFKFKLVHKNFQIFIKDFIQVNVKEIESQSKRIGEAENYVAAYIEEMNKQESPYLDETNLMRCVFDLFITGMDTTGLTTDWFMLYMINYPDIQEKAYKEIEEQIGLNRLPTFEDKSKVPYVCAVIMEVQRMACVLPLMVPRTVQRTVTLNDYVIPEGAWVIFNMDSVLHEKSTWGPDAEEFRPERFLDKEGNIITPEAWVPFSLGKRVCPGEIMARTQLFLLVCRLLQRFKLCPADEKNIPSTEPVYGISNNPKPYKIRFVSRRTK